MCGSDLQMVRSRTVRAPARGLGATCGGATQEAKPCFAECELSAWGQWSTCDLPCMGGQRNRSRVILQEPSGTGECAADVLQEVEGCDQGPCPSSTCRLSAWSDWSACSVSCGQGHQSRSRHVADAGGGNCSFGLAEVRGCAGSAGSQSCPEAYQDCGWSDWEDWEACSRECQGGHRARRRSIAHGPSGGGQPCAAEVAEEVLPCNTQRCASACRDGSWAAWSDWEACSQACAGVTWRKRAVAETASECGTPAQGNATEVARCNEDSLCAADVDCEFGTWSDWTKCSSACQGSTERHRSIAVFPRGSGSRCRGPLNESAPCNPAWGEEAPAGCQVLAPAACETGDWSAWGSCSVDPKTCTRGQQMRSRSVHAPSDGGHWCNESVDETQSCFSSACKCTPIHCEWGDWEDWGICDVCGGEARRHRPVKQYPSCGGGSCTPGASMEVAQCDRKYCHRAFCAWSVWGDWGACSASCGNATQARLRRLDTHNQSPLPAGGLGAYDLQAVAGAVSSRLGAAQRPVSPGPNPTTGRVELLTAAFAGGIVSFVAVAAVLRRIRRE